MRYLVAILALIPGNALAHGGHAPVPESLHALTHSGAAFSLALIGFVVVLGWVLKEWWRS